MKRTGAALGVAVFALALVALAQAPSPESGVDKVFTRWTATTPGCAVGVNVKGQNVLERAYGMADLEHGVANKADTIFEAGSVSKQFTAAAVLLLAREGKLSLDDPARKYVPELPDYGKPLTIRHMLQHTSGLRDWGEVAGLAGWPRTTRVHTHAHVLDILSRQRSLNFMPGEQWSYSNSGYNLSAVIVSRVSGKAFAEFTRERIFTPLGMTRTSWRDDYTRVVKDRAIAYSERGGEFRTNMPFENVHGNGGLLTTVGDLLRWDQNPVVKKVGDDEFLRIQHQEGTLNSGKPHGYALGLFIGEHKGLKAVSHSGSTAGYRAHLIRLPDQRVSVAVLCNAANANATQYAEQVADLYLAGQLKSTTTPEPNPGRRPAAPSNLRLTPEQLSAYAGTYYSDEAEATYVVVADGDKLSLKRRPDVVTALTPTGTDTFSGGAATIKFIRDASGTVTEISVAVSRVFDMRFRKTT
jgi:CubicO group peptidase (beta-lactamase class C family)